MMFLDYSNHNSHLFLAVISLAGAFPRGHVFLSLFIGGPLLFSLSASLFSCETFLPRPQRATYLGRNIGFDASRPPTLHFISARFQVIGPKVYSILYVTIQCL